MLRSSLLLTTCLLILHAATAQRGWSDKSRLLPDSLRRIPVGLTLTHTNNPCVPVREGDTYLWKHSTLVRADVGELWVVEAGSYIWYDSTGWHPNLRLSADEFAERFNCPGGNLKTGQTYTFAKNWRYGKQAYGGDALWYVLARDRTGRLYKGYGLIETEGLR